MITANTQVRITEPGGLPRFRTVLYLLLAGYAAFRAVSFGAALGGGQGAAIPAVIESTVPLQVWMALWTGGALLHILAIRWEWARRATIWTFSLKGLGVASAFVLSAFMYGGSLSSLGGLLSYGFPVMMLWMVEWSAAMRTTVEIESVPSVEASTVAEAARQRITATTGEIPEVSAYGSPE